MSRYYPLHVHLANGSVGDSILKVKDYVNKGKELGLSALAVTDHGSMSAIYSLANECREQGIKPIIGMEAYEVDDIHERDKKETRYHLALLAKTQEGFENLLRLHNMAQTDGFYYRPRIDMSMIDGYGKGIICLTACVSGRIPKAILRDDMEYAKSALQMYQEYFDEVYLEIQPGSFEEQIKVNRGMVELSKSEGAPLIVTNDVHYLNPEDADTHNAHVLLGRHSSSTEYVYPDKCYWMMDENQICDAFEYDEKVTPEIVWEAVLRTQGAAESCSVSLPSKTCMPSYDTMAEEEARELLYDICYEALEKEIPLKSNPSAYLDQMEKELEVISSKGFCGYFLIVRDYINYARENDIAVGPGRGSAAGSLVSYLLGISQVDPLEHGLMFERFLDPHREAIPDVDVDFEPGENGRERMFRYITEKYGKNRSALVSTFNIRKAKGAVRDAARVLGYEPKVGDEIAKLIPVVYYGDDGEKQTDLELKTAVELVPELKSLEKKYPKVIQLAASLQDLPSSNSIHAAGILISPDPLDNKIPLIQSKKEGILATSLTLENAEAQLVKFDMLSLSYLGIIKETERQTGFRFDYRKTDLYNDEAVWNLIGSKNTTGLFQISSYTYKKRMWRLAPKTIDELAACLALVRGPCISTGMDEKYMTILQEFRKTGEKNVEYLCPEFDEPTKDTFGIPIFQEQIMQIFVNFGFDLTTGYKFIKAAAHKKIDKLKSYRNEFMKKANEKGIDSSVASKIFDLLEASGAYSFNKSHAVSYAMVTYASAYLKVHYPVEYMASYFSYVYSKGKKDLYFDAVTECKRIGIPFLPVSVNNSSWEFVAENGKIRIGMSAIKGLGDKAYKHLEESRMEKPFSSFCDFLERVAGASFNKACVVAGIWSGLFDELLDGKSRYDLFTEYMESRKEEVPSQVKMGGVQTVIDGSLTYKRIEELYYNVVFDTAC